MEELRKIGTIELDRLSVHDMLALVSKVNLGLNELTPLHFPSVAENLVRYGQCVYRLYKIIPQAELQNAISLLETHLRRIKVLSQVNSLDRLNTLYDQFKVQITQIGKKVVTNLKPGSYADYYQQFRMNLDLEDASQDCLALVEWLLNDQTRYIAPHHYPRVIRDSVTAFVESTQLCAFLNQRARSELDVRYAMECAFKQAHLQLVIDLVKLCAASFPNDIQHYEVLLPCIIANKGNPHRDQLLSHIEKMFSSQSLFEYGLTHFDYHIVAHYLPTVKFPDAINAFSQVISIAASCGDIEFINQILKKYPGDNSQFIQEQVLPFYQPRLSQKRDSSLGLNYAASDQQKYQSVFNRMVGILHYYIKQQRFTFSILEEKQHSHLFGPLRCGYLRKIIAFTSSKLNDNYRFGSLRDCLTHTSPTTNGALDQYFSRCQTFFTALARHDASDTNNAVFPDLISYSYQVKLEPSPQVITLTRHVGTLTTGVIEWIHTDPKYFEVISDHVQRLYQQLILSSEKPQNTLQYVSKIQFYLAQGNYYNRGSGAVCEIIAHAQFKSLRLFHPSVTPLRSDCMSLINIDENCYTESYPSIFGFTSFEELYENVSAAYSIYEKQDQTAYDQKTNQLLLLSDLQHHYQTAKDKVAPNPNTLLRRIAGFKSVTELHQCLLFVTDINQVDSGNYQRTALHWAIVENKIENVKALIDAGALSDIPDGLEKKTAEQYAAESTIPEIQSIFSRGLKPK